MTYIKSAWLFLRGKKTYIVAALTLILGLLQKDQAMILGGLALFGLRDALPAPQSN